MIMNFHFMHFFFLEHAELVKNKSFVSFYDDFE